MSSRKSPRSSAKGIVSPDDINLIKSIQSEINGLPEKVKTKRQDELNKILTSETPTRKKLAELSANIPASPIGSRATSPTPSRAASPIPAKPETLLKTSSFPKKSASNVTMDTSSGSTTPKGSEVVNQSRLQRSQTMPSLASSTVPVAPKDATGAAAAPKAATPVVTPAATKAATGTVAAPKDATPVVTPAAAPKAATPAVTKAVTVPSVANPKGSTIAMGVPVADGTSLAMQQPSFMAGQYPGINPMGFNQASTLDALGRLKEGLDTRSLPITLLLPLVLALVAVIIGFIISIYYVILLIIMVIQQSAITSPLNIETVDYASIQSLTFFTPGQFNYMYFLLLPIVAILGIAIFTAFATLSPPSKPLPREIKGLVFVIGLSAIIIFFVQGLIYQKIGKTIMAVEKRLKYFNSYVCSKIYKKIPFLAKLQNPQASIVGVHNTIQNSLQLIEEKTPYTEMAKAFFTISMFYHYQKISLRNPIIFDAFNLFNHSTLLSRGCQPGAYLARYGTYIEDISETLLRPQLSKTIPITEVDKAFILCNEWITNANGYANTIYPEDSFSSFVIMAIITVLIQFIPIYLIIKFYIGGEDNISKALNALMAALGISTSQQEGVVVRG